MKKKITCLAVLLLCFLLLSALAACKKEEPAPAALTGAEITGTLKEEYVRNEAMDLSGITVTASYDDGTTKVFTVKDDAVSVTGGDTQASGADFTLTVRFASFEKVFHYSVRDTVLTLVLGDGSCSGERSFTFSTPENYTDLTDYLPVPDDENKEFAGWFTDAAFRTPVESNFGGKVDTSADTTLYAGDDIDYTDVFSYEEVNGEITLTELSSSMLLGTGRLTIPDTVRLRPVTKIGENFISEYYAGWLEYDELYFCENSAVREIGKSAFAGWKALKNIVFPATLIRIDASAFCATGIEELHFPASLERIGENAFEANDSLVLLDFGTSPKLSEIGMSAFRYCRALPEVTLPESLSALGIYAFSGCESLTEVTIGANLKNIGLHAFQSCANLAQFRVDSLNTAYQAIDGNLYSKDGKTFIRYCFGKNEEEFALPEGVTTIYESAFDSLLVNTTLERIILPESLVSIEDYAFRSTGASFTIPAGVSRISEFAFSNSAITWFAVAEKNNTFCVLDGVLYSKDMTELVAIPTLYPISRYVLDARVKRILPGAFNYNDTVSEFVIPADSALEVIEARALIPFQAKELNGIFIEKATPFRLAPGAMHNNETVINRSFLLYIGAEHLGDYLAAWGDYETLSGNGIAEYVMGTDRICQEILDRIAGTIGAFSDADTLLAALKDFLQEKLDDLEYRQYSVYGEFTDIMRILNGAYRSGADLSQIREELIAFENTLIGFLTDLYAGNIGNVEEFILQTNFRTIYAHYLLIPAEIRAQMSDFSAGMTAILAETERIAAIQQEILTKAPVVAENIEKFDVDTARWIMENYQLYNLVYVSCQWSDLMHIYRVQCSLMIYDFLEAGISADSLQTLRGLLGDDYTETPCIEMYLKGYFRSESARAELYRYSDFVAARAALELATPDLVAQINREVEEFDFSQFDLANALRVIRNYDGLSLAEQDFSVVLQYSALRYRSALLRLTGMKISEATYAEASSLLADVKRYDNEFSREISCVSDEELADFAEKEQQLLAACEKKNAAFIATVKAEGKGGKHTPAEMEALYQAVMDDSLLSYLTITVTDADGNPLTLNLMEAYNSIMRRLLIREFAADFDSVSEDNYYDAYYRIYGGFIGGMYVNGISFYERLESQEASAYYEPLLLTQEEILHYNDLLEQFNKILLGE